MEQTVTKPTAEYEMDINIHNSKYKVFEFQSAKEYVKTSRFNGVSWHKRNGKWQARVVHDGKQQTVGYFQNESAATEAVSKYNRMEKLKQEKRNQKKKVKKLSNDMDKKIQAELSESEVLAFKKVIEVLGKLKKSTTPQNDVFQKKIIDALRTIFKENKTLYIGFSRFVPKKYKILYQAFLYQNYGNRRKRRYEGEDSAPPRKKQKSSEFKKKERTGVHQGSQRSPHVPTLPHGIRDLNNSGQEVVEKRSEAVPYSPSKNRSNRIATLTLASIFATHSKTVRRFDTAVENKQNNSICGGSDVIENDNGNNVLDFDDDSDSLSSEEIAPRPFGHPPHVMKIEKSPPPHVPQNPPDTDDGDDDDDGVEFTKEVQGSSGSQSCPTDLTQWQVKYCPRPGCGAEIRRTDKDVK